MVRNIVLAVSTLAVLAVLLVVYNAVIVDPLADGSRDTPGETLRPNPPQEVEPIRVGEEIAVPAGGEIVFRMFNERTGQPTDLFSCRDWQPVPGRKNEIRVSAPRLVLLMPSGMLVTITADEGQLVVDRVERSQMRPKTGSLTGDVRIVVDRDTSVQRTPAEQRPQDLITFAVPQLSFDLELGRMQTDERIALTSADFELSGRGLSLVWNQVDNRVETLTIEQGEEFVLYAATGVFKAVTDADTRTPTHDASQTQPAKKSKKRKHRQRRATTYECVLNGDVVAEQFSDGERAGALTADEIRLLFDVGGQEGRYLQARQTPTTTSAPATAPATLPAPADRDRLVVRWSGPLHMVPLVAEETDAAGRRHFTAIGSPVLVERGQGALRCQRLVYHDETQRVWLHPMPNERIDVTLGEKMRARAESVYVDRTARVIKLVGSVDLESGGAQSTRRSSIRCSYWAELHLSDQAGPVDPVVGDALAEAQQLESAIFVGDVLVDLNPQTLSTHRLEITFNDRRGEALDQMLDTATASGSVQLTSGDGMLRCAELALDFGLTPSDAVFPRQMTAVGDARIERGRASLRGNRIHATLAAPPDDADQATFVLRQLNIIGEGELLDPDNRVAARGEEIIGRFVGMNDLKTARVTGSRDEFGMVYAEPYTVRGSRIDLDRDAQSLVVDGESLLAFKSRRGLQGRRRARAIPVVVRSMRSLRIDARANEVLFEGEVVAHSGEEELQADSLRLILEDLPAASPDRPAGWTGLWQELRRLWPGQPSGQDAEGSGLFAFGEAREDERVRKEPVRLIAERALVTSETYEPDDDIPVVHASISAPQLRVEVRDRQIITDGLTQLLMTDRRGIENVDNVEKAMGIPSALVTRGPSQTAMQCEGRMIYTIGPDGPDRRDTAVFEEAVVFVHRTGQYMVNLEKTLPRVASDPELLAALQSRSASLDCDRLECWFVGDDQAGGPRGTSAFTQAPLQLASLIADGNVYLRDQEGSRVREVNAAWIEFNREQGRIRVRGTDMADARVYFEDIDSGHFDVHAGEELIISLRDGSIRSDRLVGELRRP